MAREVQRVDSRILQALGVTSPGQAPAALLEAVLPVAVVEGQPGVVNAQLSYAIQAGVPSANEQIIFSDPATPTLVQNRNGAILWRAGFSADVAGPAATILGMYMIPPGTGSPLGGPATPGLIMSRRTLGAAVCEAELNQPIFLPKGWQLRVYCVGSAVNFLAWYQITPLP